MGDSFFYRIGAKSADFPSIGKGDVFEIHNERYAVVDVVRDEYNLSTEIILNKEGQR